MNLIKNVKNNVLLKGAHYITSDYKTRNKKRSHNGIDLIGMNKSIDKVVSIAPGTVLISKKSSTAGNYVEILHDNGYISRYLHMKDGSVKVKKGDKVLKGTILGTMGNTGNSNGSHLHFSILNQNRLVQDPLPYLLGEKDFQKNNNHQKFVKDVQKILNIKVDGIAGKDTLANTITVSANVNRKHKIVKVLQEYLQDLGYKIVGTADGIAGANFTKAVEQFQKDNDCVVDGIITAKGKTWQKLLKIK